MEIFLFNKFALSTIWLSSNKAQTEWEKKKLLDFPPLFTSCQDNKLFPYHPLFKLILCVHRFHHVWYVLFNCISSKKEVGIFPCLRRRSFFMLPPKSF